ncbi:MAG: (5-formylfuran-3-yl)methyl phosphate synthase, partial [Methylophilaceae bacterium]
MQLLISVKNSEEALIALHAGADVIDLKDPNIGALGALDLETTAQILKVLDGRATVSA